MNLLTLKDNISEDGLPASFEPATEGFDAERVNVKLDIDGFAEPLTLQITEIETDQIKDLEMVQLYAPISIELGEAQARDILQILPEINEAVPLIGFNIHPEEKFVYFRHVMLVPEGNIGLKVVTEGTWMAHFALDMFAGRIAAIALT
jgi:hypothetical protein